MPFFFRISYFLPNVGSKAQDGRLWALLDSMSIVHIVESWGRGFTVLLYSLGSLRIHFRLRISVVPVFGRGRKDHYGCVNDPRAAIG